VVSVHEKNALKGEPPTEEAVLEALKSIKGVHSAVDVPSDDTAHSFALQVSGEVDIRPEIFRMAVQKGWLLLELHRDAQSLGDVFRDLTKAESRVARGLRAMDEDEDDGDDEGDEEDDVEEDEDEEEGEEGSK